MNIKSILTLVSVYTTIIFIIASCLGCGPSERRVPSFIVNSKGEPGYVDEELRPLLLRFEADMIEGGLSMRLGTLSAVRFNIEGDPVELSAYHTDRASLEGQILGRCYFPNPDYGVQGKIIINRHAWDVMGEGARKVLLYHEAGHCLLGLAHTEKRTSADELDPIMDATLSVNDETTPRDKWSELLDDFIEYAKQ